MPGPATIWVSWGVPTRRKGRPHRNGTSAFPIKHSELSPTVQTHGLDASTYVERAQSPHLDCQQQSSCELRPREDPFEAETDIAIILVCLQDIQNIGRRNDQGARRRVRTAERSTTLYEGKTRKQIEKLYSNLKVC